MKIELKFHFALNLLQDQGGLILQAAESGQYSALVERLDDGVVAEGRGLWDGLFEPIETGTVVMSASARAAKTKGKTAATLPAPAGPAAGSSAAQVSAAGAVGELTKAQKDALKIYKPHAAKARKAGKKVFKGQTVKLHDEFRVTSTPPTTIRDIVADGRLLLTAVRNPAYTAELKSKGAYIAKDADALEAALNALAATETDQEGAKGLALDATDARNQKLNRLFDIVILIQAAANNEYTDRKSRLAFRLGLFPPAKQTKKPAAKSAAPPPAS